MCRTEFQEQSHRKNKYEVQGVVQSEEPKQGPVFSNKTMGLGIENPSRSSFLAADWSSQASGTTASPKAWGGCTFPERHSCPWPPIPQPHPGFMGTSSEPSKRPTDEKYQARLDGSI